ncbi:MAG: hypothetical protein RQ899_11995 [Pseudomonadales bacterium]|nr:hypothetical protein [Pseudomonadales bacterium]
MSSKILPVLCLLTPLAAVPALAQVPHTFIEGEPAVAAQVNTNFEALDGRIQDLLERITALETQLVQRSGTEKNPSVAGGAYLVRTQIDALWALNAVAAQGVIFSGGLTIFEFNGDGTGQSKVLSCDGNRLHDEDFQPAEGTAPAPGFIVQVRGCQQVDVPMTYVQNGNDLTISFPNFSANWLTSDDGSLITSLSVSRNAAAPCDEGSCTLQNGTRVVTLGFRVWDLE